MQILRTLPLLAIAAVSPLQTTVRPEVVTVTAVTDGGTIVVAGYGRVKLAGIKPPRLGRGLTPDAPFARQARERLEGVVISRFVRLEFEPGSTRAYVRLEGGGCVNATLVLEGLAAAEAAVHASHATCAAEIVRAEQQARALHRGIWSLRPSSLRPSAFTAATPPHARAAPASHSAAAPTATWPRERHRA